MSNILSYTVENISMIFNQLKSTDETRSCYWFTVSVDGMEIIPLTDELKHFNDFMSYDLSHSQRLEINLYHAPHRQAYSYAFFLQQTESENWKTYMDGKVERLKKENEEFQSQIKTLKQTVRKQDRKKYYEKPEGIKAIDAGDFIVVFVSKKEIDNALGEQLKQARSGLSALEKVERIFHRLIYQTKK